MINNTLFQSFHWYLPSDGTFWKFCSSEAARWSKLGFTHIYLPPAFKSGFGTDEAGYAVYDLFDLGEFDQKGTVRTKYGTKDEYIKCINDMKRHGLQVIADVVLNHKVGADDTEKMPARQVHFDNRIEFAGEEQEIEAYTKFDFPGRNGKYSEFKWNWRTFTGVDDEFDGEKRIYKILNGYGHGWDDILDDQYGNFDYLMGADIEFRNEHVREELKRWGTWYYETTGVDGFRLDAVKHISPDFFREWLDHMNNVAGKNFFIVSEFWHADVSYLASYFDAMDGRTQLFDAPLHYNFYEASMKGSEYDLRTIFDGSFLQIRPEATVTFVDNHDTQPLQSLESSVDFWFKPLAYAIILFREQGLPCVFNPSLYGAEYTDTAHGESHDIFLHGVPMLDRMLLTRRYLSYGLQRDYFDHPNTVGWTREGIDEMESSGIAVVMTNGSDGDKEMEMGQRNAGKTYIDITGNRPETVITDEHGKASFPVNGGEVSIWVVNAASSIFQQL